MPIFFILNAKNLILTIFAAAIMAAGFLEAQDNL